MPSSLQHKNALFHTSRINDTLAVERYRLSSASYIALAFRGEIPKAFRLLLRECQFVRLRPIVWQIDVSMRKIQPSIHMTTSSGSLPIGCFPFRLMTLETWRDVATGIRHRQQQQLLKPGADWESFEWLTDEEKLSERRHFKRKHPSTRWLDNAHRTH